ncbi:MAG: amidase [Cereibacter sphaeroides]|uniref:Amidase n=1 Tax=Cereibacter sphaeroides TaxID=1063 RepID=A0A2W5S4Y6_CERSP|nr:MAG: amidase [Cereibacter sphaeroides]
MDLTKLSACDLSRMIAAREVAPSEVMMAFLDRIEAVNPLINAIVALRDHEALMAESRAADDAEPRGWLHGLPFAVKDLQNVAGIRSTQGFPGLVDFVPEADEMLPRRLRAAGAILIGKTNAPEFGLGSHSFNPVYGVTGNPYDPSRSAGGSSGGAAAALAARLVPVADGSDMMGSLRNPAAFCNVYGFRPTFGLVPYDPGGDAFLNTLATDGPMARNVEDLARLLETLAVPSPADPHARGWEPFAAALDVDVRGTRIGWLGDWGGAYPMEPGILETCGAALKALEEIGCVIEPVAAPFPAEALWESWVTLRSWANAVGKAELYADPKQRALLKPEAIWEIERGQGLSAVDVHRASVIRSDWYTALSRLFERYDALVLPSAQVWPFPKEWRWPESVGGRVSDTYHRWMEVVIPVSLVGLPALAMPAGFGAGSLPMGVQVFGPKGSDRRLLRLGQAYHRATDWPGKRPPKLM